MADLATKLTNALFEADQQRMILGADLRDPDRRGIEEVLRKALAGLIPEGSFVEKLKALKIGHDYCEDPWYSCPLAEDGCADDRKGPGCECGADAHNAKVDALIAACSPQARQSSEGK